MRLVLALMLLTGAAHADALNDVKALVDGRMTYAHSVTMRSELVEQYRALS